MENSNYINTFKDLMTDITNTSSLPSYSTPFTFIKGDKKKQDDVIKKFVGIWKYTTQDDCNVNLLREELEPADYDKIRSLVRSELASVMFFLFKKRSFWIGK